MKIPFLISIILVVPIQISLGQDNMQQFLDDLLVVRNVANFEKSEGNEAKAKFILSSIDTSLVSTNTIDKVLSYYELHNPAKEEYPFPLLLWAKRSAKKLNYNKGLFNSLLQLGDANRFLFKDKEYDHYNEALSLAKLENNEAQMAKATGKLALQNMAYRQYKSAITYFFEALDINKKLKSASDVKRMYHCLGDCYMRIDELDNAIKYLELSENVLTNDSDSGIDAMNKGFLGELYLKNGEYKKAFKYLRASNNIIKNQGVVPYLKTYNLLNLGKLKEYENDLEMAQDNYRKAFALSYKVKPAVRMHILTGAKWANVLNKQNKFEESRTLLEHIETHSIKQDDTQFIEVINTELANFYQVFAETYHGTNNFEKAYNSRVKQITYANNANDADVKKNAAELEKKYQSQIDQQQIQLLTKETNLQQRNLIITIMGLIGVISVALFIYVYYRQRSKSLQRKAELTSLDLEKEQIKAEKLEQEKQISELELQLKQRELTTNSISLLQKKEQFNKMEAALKELKPLVNQNQKASQLLNGIISDCLASKTTYNWEEFRLTFEKVHPEFYKTILQVHPNLSTNEKKLAAFLKLGLNSKDISSITQQANRTIVIARSRLRKKLLLDKEVNLVNYISKF